MKIGVLSDTHNLLRPQVLPALAGCDHILHAGDIGGDAILAALESIAPVTAIRGNTDSSGRASTLPDTEAVELGGHLFYLIHSVHDLDLNPVSAGISVVVSGHSHKPSWEQRNGVHFLNPGSAGPRRFTLPVTLATLNLTDTTLTHQLVDLLQP